MKFFIYDGVLRQSQQNSELNIRDEEVCCIRANYFLLQLLAPWTFGMNKIADKFNIIDKPNRWNSERRVMLA